MFRQAVVKLKLYQNQLNQAPAETSRQGADWVHSTEYTKRRRYEAADFEDEGRRGNISTS